MLKKIFSVIFGLIMHIVIFILDVTDYSISFILKASSQDFGKAKSKRYAVLVLGAGLINSHLLSLDKIHREAYLGLKKRGYKDKEIFILSFTKLHKGFNKIPSIKNLREIFSFIERSSHKNTKIVFHFIGHGKREEAKSTMKIGLGKIDSLEFYNLVKNIKGKKILIFDQCYSGGFLEEFKKEKDIVILASTKKEYVTTNKVQVEIDFWKEIAQGKNVVEAYNDAAEKYGKLDPSTKKLLNLIYGSKIGDFYLIYSKGKVDI